MTDDVVDCTLGLDLGGKTMALAYMHGNLEDVTSLLCTKDYVIVDASGRGRIAIPTKVGVIKYVIAGHHKTIFT